MNLVVVSELFEVRYGVNLELNRLTVDQSGIAFIGRSAKNNGITGRVKPISGLDPIPAGTLTVAGGGSVLATFVQMEPYYSGRDLYYLTPKIDMTLNQKLYYCVCIQANKYRYNYGRQANRTLRDIMIPDLDSIPDWVGSADPSMFDGSSVKKCDIQTPDLGTINWKAFLFQDLFDLKKGKRLTKANMNPGKIPFIGAIDSNNGRSNFVTSALYPGNTITVNYNGAGVAEAFYQPEPYWASDDVNVLYPRFKLTPEIALFVATVIRQEKYRFSYGRKWHMERMKTSTLHLPITKDREPDWKFMESYIATLPYSSQVGDA